MAEQQGRLSIFQRRDELLLYPRVIWGGWPEGNVWHGWDFFDDERPPRLLSVDIDDDQLGASLRQALIDTRLKIPGGQPNWNDRRYREKIARGFEMPRMPSSLTGIKNSNVEWALGSVRLQPMARGRGGFAWFAEGWNKGHEDIIIPFTSPDAELGAAVREALRRSL